MGKVIETLCLNGKNAGEIHKIELEYTQEQEDEAKRKLMFTEQGIKFAGWCRCCNLPVKKGQENYLVNVDGLGNVQVDIFHKWCNRS